MDINFGSLKTRRRLAEKMMREYRKSYPKPFCSNTLIDSFILRHNRDNAFIAINRKLKVLMRKYGEKIDIVRTKYNYEHQSWSEYVEELKKAVLSENAANCGEQAILMQDIFLRNGEEAHNVDMFIYRKKNIFGRYKLYKDHSFIVTGLDKGADIREPKTWGNEAVVVDPWCNIVLGAREAIDYFKKILNFNSKHHRTVFESADIMDIKKYLSKVEDN